MSAVARAIRDDEWLHVRRWLDSVKAMDGIDHGDDLAFHRGRILCERMATEQEMVGEMRPLSLAAAADVLHFISNSQPLAESAPWGGPETCGLNRLLDAAQDAMRRQVRR